MGKGRVTLNAGIFFIWPYSFTINSEIFARVLFSSHMQSFVKRNPSRNVEITLSLTNIGKSCPSHKFFNAVNMSFDAICENKILVKMS